MRAGELKQPDAAAQHDMDDVTTLKDIEETHHSMMSTKQKSTTDMASASKYRISQEQQGAIVTSPKSIAMDADALHDELEMVVTDPPSAGGGSEAAQPSSRREERLPLTRPGRSRVHPENHPTV